jgi:two-component sensor histidine kinase
VQSIAFNSFRASNPQAYQAFEERLISLASVHDLLTQDSWTRTPVEKVVRLAIAMFNADRFDISGPDATLEPRAVAALAMTLHELSTNAVKYGSLSRPEGRVVIEWAIERRGTRTQLVLNWTEQGGPLVSSPRADGFGLRLIKRAAAADIGASVEHRLDSAGVTCRIVMPIETAVLT